ncbi:MAG: hypothetical protein GWN61_10055 [candidate division Zixibacteria bacterium]|nr:hypothetical protein [candidate division Zixibacteria bacterium]NIV06503.1 hypothetical protein [candidate division Zixibacteria bacterium]NIW69819.1 hypothetical protein [candidate division KSB1 bacterium]
MSKDNLMQQLWNSSTAGDRTFDAAQVSHVPDTVRRYFEHSIAPGTRFAHAVRLRMHGEIKLQRWCPFRAEQVIVWERGFIWQATVRMFGLPIRGYDRLIDGEGAMRWKLFGIIPMVTASGPDITRSAAGRVAAESLWLPSVLCSEEVSWTELDSSHLQASFTMHGEKVEPQFSINDNGRLQSVKLSRWGNPEGDDFRYTDFGAIVEEENTFGGYTIPTRLRVGWYFGIDRFETEGEFFRVTIDEATYR